MVLGKESVPFVCDWLNICKTSFSYVTELRLFLMDEAWRHAVLEAAVTEEQMQSIDECMREVAAQMHERMIAHQYDDCEIGLDQDGHLNYGINQLCGVENEEADANAVDLLTLHHEQAVGSNVLFQVICARVARKLLR